MKCRFCNKDLEHSFADLQNSPFSNDFLEESQLTEPETYYPLKLYVCEECFLVQIDKYKHSTDIFNDHYAYYSSFSKSWVEHARKYVEMMVKRFHYDSNSKIVEIASNDGYLLQHFKSAGIPCVGIEPAKNVATKAILMEIPTLIEYFGISLAKRLSDSEMLADLIIGNNVIAHVPDINNFVEGMKILLRDKGIITLEFPHLLSLIRDCEFDTIYHEHFSYLSFYALRKIFNAHSMDIFDVDLLNTHGGSLRIFGKHKNDDSKPITDSVFELDQIEQKAGINNLDFYLAFQERIDKIRLDFQNFLIEQKIADKKVIGYGAAAKGNTLLNYSGIKGNHLIDFVVDACHFKQNKFLPGSHIPVVDESRIKEYKPDWVIIFPWNIKEEIMDQISYIGEWGGKFITFIPSKKIYEPTLTLI